MTEEEVEGRKKSQSRKGAIKRKGENKMSMSIGKVLRKNMTKTANLVTAGINKVMAAGSTKILSLKLPEMIKIDSCCSIMKNEVTVGLFKQVMDAKIKGMNKYEITGHNANKLLAVLNDKSKQNDSLTYVSLNDGRKFAERLSIITGRKFRVPLEREISGQIGTSHGLEGDNGTLTETKHTVMGHGTEKYIIVYPEAFGYYKNDHAADYDANYCKYSDLADRYDFSVIRLVERLDLPPIFQKPLWYLD